MTKDYFDGITFPDGFPLVEEWINLWLSDNS